MHKYDGSSEKSLLSKNMNIAVTPFVLTPFVPFRGTADISLATSALGVVLTPKHFGHAALIV